MSEEQDKTSKKTKEQFNFRVSSELVREFKEKLEGTGKTITTALVEYMTAVASGKVSLDAPGQNLGDIQEIEARLEERLGNRLEERLSAFRSEVMAELGE